MSGWLTGCWYRPQAGCRLLRPFAWLFALLADTRRLAYRRGWLAARRLPVPVVVVGNISVGGTGKTPLTLWLATRLREAGWRPGIVSRGYGGTTRLPEAVPAEGDPARFGDEPVLLSRRAGCPVWVGRRRHAAGQALLAAHPEVNVILADDGLQHYALARDMEIAVVDGQRGLGNGLRLPAGPLREAPERLAEVDAVVIHGAADVSLPGHVPRYLMELAVTGFWNLRQPDRRAGVDVFMGRPVKAVAGIGHPERFFTSLAALGIRIEGMGFPDHHRFSPADLPSGTVLMTEKDAVKCVAWAGSDVWACAVDARVGEGLIMQVIDMLERHHGSQTA